MKPTSMPPVASVLSLSLRAILLPTILAGMPAVTLAQAPATTAQPPSLRAVAPTTLITSEMAGTIARFEADYGAVLRTYRVEASPSRQDRLTALLQAWIGELASINFDALGRGGQVDYILLRSRIEALQAQQALDAGHLERIIGFAPFASIIIDLEDARRKVEPMGGTGAERAAEQLTKLRQQIDAAAKSLDENLNKGGDARPAIADCKRALDLVSELRDNLREWFGFYSGYDPMVTWWCQKPFENAEQAFDNYTRMLRERAVGITPQNENVIVGTPIGRDGLTAALKAAMIPYTPEEILAIGEREQAWCEAELRKAAAEMGLGDDWKAALEKVKQDHLQPGEQPKLIRDLADEAIKFLRDRDLITIPELADETWRMEMMSPQRQLVTPFFTGGEVISVSFPVASMEHQQKLMTLRGNNIHFSRATVHHELIPGHHLQQFMCSRYNTQRDPFGTPFWTEGWALYWEMRMWDLNFAKSPQNKIGMLFWRNHRCARIVFSLKFHLGQMTPQEAVDYLVEHVGHERANAEGEVRRSFNGMYGPLYQAAYMLGGLQFRAMQRELVGVGTMTDKQFHDAIMLENNMPVEMVRAVITKEPLKRDQTTTWRFDPIQLGK